MKIDREELLKDLKDKTANHHDRLALLTKLSDSLLQARPAEGKWNVLENIEHLNRYAAFYVPTMESAASKAKHSGKSVFASGYLGNKFAISMLPSSKMMKVNTFKSKNPIGDVLTREVLDTFRSYLHNISEIIAKVSDLDLEIKTSTTIPLVKIKLGDTLRVVIYHHERHFKQIDECLSVVRKFV